jgi:hypothetical protein
MCISMTYLTAQYISFSVSGSAHEEPTVRVRSDENHVHDRSQVVPRYAHASSSAITTNTFVPNCQNARGLHDIYSR